MWFQICRCLIYQRQKRLGSFSRYGLVFCFPHFKSHCELVPSLESFYILSRLSFQKWDFHWGQLLHVRIKQGEFFTQVALHSFIHSFIHSMTVTWAPTIGARRVLNLRNSTVNKRDRLLPSGSSGSSELHSTRVQAPWGQGHTDSHSGLFLFLCLLLEIDRHREDSPLFFTSHTS